MNLVYVSLVKNWRFHQTLLFFAVITVGSLTANAIMIPLRSDWIPNPSHRAGPAYLWQNDPEVLKEFGAASVTNFCIPASIGTALLNQYAFESPASSFLKIGGITQEIGKNPVINTAKFLSDLSKRCKADVKDGTTIDDGVKCSADFYRDSGYAGAKVKLIRKYPYDITGSGIQHDNRLATLTDIETALSQGYQVIASIATIQYSETTKEWVKLGSHSINVVGVKTNGTDLATLYIVNSNRMYRVDGINPVFDEALLTKVDDKTAATLPEKYAALAITGRILNRPNSLTVLAGLMLLRTH